MRRGIAGLFLVSLLIVAGKAAQNPVENQTPVWMVEVLKVKPGMLGSTLGYLDDNWMRVRAEAKRQGAVLDYHRIADRDSVTSDPSILSTRVFEDYSDTDNARFRLLSKN